MSTEIHQGDALAVLRTLPSDSVHCVVTSPPYFGLRDYGVDGQIGLEPTPEAWCTRLVEVFREVRRVLRPDGVCFVNIGDSYASTPTGSCRTWPGDGGGFRAPERMNTSGLAGLKPKDLLGQPWMLAFALRADGWWLRAEIIWAKPSPRPESVEDRPAKAHEQLFMFTKSARYFYDGVAIKERASAPSGGRQRAAMNGDGRYVGEVGGEYHEGRPGRFSDYQPPMRNARSVWTIATEPLPSIEVDGEKLDHFASYPTELARRCILAGTSAKGCCPACGAPWARVVDIERSFESGSGRSGNMPVGKNGAGMQGGGATLDIRRGPTVHTTTTGWRPTCSCPPAEPIPCVVLDPFLGSGRTALAAEELGRDCIGIELNPKSVRMAQAVLERAKARRYIGDAERVPAMAGQLGLWDAEAPPG